MVQFSAYICSKKCFNNLLLEIFTIRESIDNRKKIYMYPYH